MFKKKLIVAAIINFDFYDEKGILIFNENIKIAVNPYKVNLSSKDYSYFAEHDKIENTNNHLLTEMAKSKMKNIDALARKNKFLTHKNTVFRARKCYRCDWNVIKVIIE